MKVIYPLTLIAVCAMPAWVHAEENTSSTGFAVLLDVGVADIAVDADGGYQEESDTTTAPALGLSYQFNDNFSLIAQYTNYGRADLIRGEFYFGDMPINFKIQSKTTAVSLVGQYMMPLASEGWSIGAKLGVVSWSSDFNLYAASAVQWTDNELGKDSGKSITGGVVAHYAISSQWALTLSADWFVNDIDNSIDFTDDGAKLDMQYGRYALGLKYAF